MNVTDAFVTLLGLVGRFIVTVLGLVGGRNSKTSLVSYTALAHGAPSQKPSFCKPGAAHSAGFEVYALYCCQRLCLNEQ